MEDRKDRYIREHSTALPEALEWLKKQTNIHTNYPRMLSGEVQGQFLKMLVEMTSARNVLEIGAFTGYSSTCMALGLPRDGHIDTLEINDELEYLMRGCWDRAGVSGKISLHLGDACETLRTFAASGNKEYDFVFIDANKREYELYLELVRDMVRPGGIIVADDTLWDGKVYEENPSTDAQTRALVAFNDKVVSDPALEVVMLPLRDGLTVIRKR
ncbi:MAG: class I SAM-dependent methyltransferase [Bacteroidales bacterium]|nr:class I SAM-dependent methyltransferase [Bacteroidales bacterium]